MARGTSTRPNESSRPAERPANYGQTGHGLRGDYSRMRPDCTVEQDYGVYTEADQDRWRRLYERQIELVPGRACDEYVEALNGLDYAGGIPRFETVTAQLEAATGWRLVAVPGLVPDLVFFEHLAFFAATAPDFTPLYRELQTLEDLLANAALPEDRLIS